MAILFHLIVIAFWDEVTRAYLKEMFPSEGHCQAIEQDHQPYSEEYNPTCQFKLTKPRQILSDARYAQSVGVAEHACDVEYDAHIGPVSKERRDVDLLVILAPSRLSCCCVSLPTGPTFGRLWIDRYEGKDAGWHGKEHHNKEDRNEHLREVVLKRIVVFLGIYYVVSPLL